MKMLREMGGCIGRRFGSYGNEFSSFLRGNIGGHYYINFCNDDTKIREILNAFESAGKEEKEALIVAYRARIQQLLYQNEFVVRPAQRHTGIPSIEVGNMPGFILSYGSDKEEFVEHGADIYFPKKYLADIKEIQKIQSGYETQKRMDGIFSIAQPIEGLHFYVVTREPKYRQTFYVEKCVPDFSTLDYNVVKMNITSKDKETLLSDCKIIA